MTTSLTLGQLITIALLTIFLVLASPILYNLAMSATAQSERAQCAISVNARLLTEDVTRGLANPFEINCARRSIFFDGNQAVILAHNRYEPVTRTTKYTYDVARTTRDGERVPASRELRADSDSVAEDVVSALAYEAEQCWELFMEGRRDLTGSEYFLANSLSCVVCAEMTTNAPESNSFREEINVREFLETRNSTISSTQTSAQTHAQYLYTTDPPSQSARCEPYDMLEEDTLVVEDDRTYVAGFYRAGSGIGWATSGLIGGEFCQAVTITTAEEFASRCVATLN